MTQRSKLRQATQTADEKAENTGCLSDKRSHRQRVCGVKYAVVWRRLRSCGAVCTFAVAAWYAGACARINRENDWSKQSLRARTHTHAHRWSADPTFCRMHFGRLLARTTRLAPRRLLTSAAHPVDYSKFLSEISRARRPSPIRELQPLFAIPGILSLGGGNPNAKTFPIGGLSFSLKDNATQISVSPQEMDAALNYGSTAGVESLLTQLKDMQRREHDSPQKNSEIVVCTGSQEALAYAFELLLDPFGKSSLLIEEATYAGSLAQLEPMGVNLVPVKVDGDGLVPESLAFLLDNWQGPNKPRVLYTIPTGANPTGGTLSVLRKKAIYAIARKHNLIILEDDPYYYLQFKTPRIPSFYSLDTDGRVLRFDSFSKILSSGLRVGFVTGPPALITPIVYHAQARAVHTSNISQIIVSKLLAAWSAQGFEDHLTKVRSFYSAQCHHLLKAVETNLSGLAEWNHPQAGMFLWLKLLGITDSSELIAQHALKEKVVLVPGKAFFKRSHGPTPFARASFSTASPDMMMEATRRLANIIRAAQKS
eukprot:m.67510 g.67510  ORF g.67510 m.67510 type:complete len:538 (+) comp49974_c0_seq2:8-1621(+)